MMNDETGANEFCKVEFSSSDGFREFYELTKLKVSIGAQTDADIGFPGLSFEHAELHHENGCWTIRKKNPQAEMRFRGHPIELKKLNPGDRIFLGAGILTFVGNSNEEITAITTLQDFPDLVEPFEMTILNGPEKGRRIRLKKGEFTLGRVSQPGVLSADSRRLEFDHRFVSRSHARIFIERYSLKVQDLGSTNGTRINGHLVKTGELKAGDLLTLGKLRLRVSGPINPQPESIPTVPIRLRDTTWNRLIWLYIVPGTLIIAALAVYFVRFHDW